MHHIFSSNCPFCGRRGRVWHSEPEVFKCPSCSSIFSKFGVIVASDNEKLEPEESEAEISN